MLNPPKTVELANLEGLYQAHWSTLVRSAWMMCGSREEAEDVVHDAFIRLGAMGSQEITNPLAYLRRCVVNLLTDRRRHEALERRHRQLPSEPVLAIHDAFTWELVKDLPERQRQALVLRYFDDLSLKEISELLDCGLPAAKSLIHRGLVQLRKEMEEQ